MAKMSELGRPEQESTGVRIQFSPQVPVEPIQMMVESCATGSCGCGCATDIEEISVEDTDAGPQIHVHGDNLSVASVAVAMAECDIPDALATSTSAAVLPDRATSARQAAIQEQYGRIAKTAEEGGEGCGCGCGCGETAGGQDLASAQLGYAPDDLTSVPAGANLGLGCGNPLAIASLRPGDTVLDLGSGGGLDCFLAAQQVGEGGHVIGVDMTPAMITRARNNAQQSADAPVEFRLGEIEHLPVADATVDVVLSNCVINLSSDKRQVFREAFRALKPGGHLALSDIVATIDIPAVWRDDVTLWTSCMAGAATVSELETILGDVGFEGIHIQPQPGSREFIREWVPGTPLADYVVSAVIEARKPSTC